VIIDGERMRCNRSWAGSSVRN